MKGEIIIRKIRHNPAYMKAGILLAVSAVCFISVYMWDNGRRIEINGQGKKILTRPEKGEDGTHGLHVKIGSREEDITVSVSERQYNEEERQQAFQEAEDKIGTLILGENKSLDEVRHDLDLITEIPDTGITVSWQADRYDVIDTQGHLQEDKLTEDGTIVKLTATFGYAGEKTSCEFYIKVFPPLKSTGEKFMEDLENQLARADEKTKTENYMILPESIDGQEINWDYSRNTRAAAILILGTGAAFMLVISDSQRKKEEEKKSARQMQIDYPKIMNKFNLYIRSGMTIRRAWFLIAKDYENKCGEKRKRKAYEEMVRTMHQIQGGIPEGECYEKYGIRCGISVYRKFGTMLSQNLRKGSGGLTELLSREAEEAFEDRKNLAKKLGEEAGTKLMIPLFLMLIVVFAIVIIPAFFSIRI